MRTLFLVGCAVFEFELIDRVAEGGKVVVGRGAGTSGTGAERESTMRFVFPLRKVHVPDEEEL